MLRKKILIVVNLKAGNRVVNKYFNIFLKHLDRNLFDINLHYTKHSSEIKALVDKAKRGSFDLVVAAGGDGTINNIAKYLVKTDIGFGIFPKGSGNGLARSIKIPFNPKLNAMLINNFNFKKIDCASLNEHYFFSVAGFGLDGKVAYDFLHKKRRGFWIYVPLIIKNIFLLKKNIFKITYEDEDKKICTTNIKAYWVSFFLGYTYGAFIKPNSEAILDDGNLEMLLFKIGGLAGILQTALGHFLGFKKTNISVLKLSKSWFKLEFSGAKIYSHIDGEPICIKPPIEIKVYKQALKVISN